MVRLACLLFLVSGLLLAPDIAIAGTENFGGFKSRFTISDWHGSWLIARDGSARHVWSLNEDGSGRVYAFTREQGGQPAFSYGYDVSWYYDPYTGMANIKTGRRLVCRRGKVYPYFLTLKSYESDYKVESRNVWQTTWTEASIGDNTLHKSRIVFVGRLHDWINPQGGQPCPLLPDAELESALEIMVEELLLKEQQQGYPTEKQPEE